MTDGDSRENKDGGENEGSKEDEKDIISLSTLFLSIHNYTHIHINISFWKSCMGLGLIRTKLDNRFLVRNYPSNYQELETQNSIY